PTAVAGAGRRTPARRGRRTPLETAALPRRRSSASPLRQIRTGRDRCGRPSWTRGRYSVCRTACCEPRPPRYVSHNRPRGRDMTTDPAVARAPEQAKADFMPLDGWDYVELWVGNAKQAAYFYEHALGFARTAYAGPETGVRDRASYVLEQGAIRLVL